MNEIYISQISLQHDWYNELRKSNQKIWASCKCKSGVTYMDINYKQDENILITTDKNFSSEFTRQHVLKVSFNDEGLSTYFFNARKTFNKIHTKSINCLDISNGGGLAVTSADDGNLFIWQTIDGEIRRSLEGHINDITHCRFFPSGEVILSGGMDMRLKIWSVEDGRCAATLTGHTGAITDTAIVEKGRNFVSCSRDGSIRLWDCGTSKCLSIIAEGMSVVNKCCLKPYESSYGNGGVSRDERESGTENKMICIGNEDGYLYSYDLYSRTQIFSYKNESSVNCCTFLNDNNIAIGLDNGKILLIDPRNASGPYFGINYGDSRVLSMKTFTGNHLLIGRGDGSCSVIEPIDSSNPIVLSLSGSDCDPIYDIAVHDNVIYTACRDKCIRKYLMDLNTTYLIVMFSLSMTSPAMHLYNASFPVQSTVLLAI